MKPLALLVALVAAAAGAGEGTQRVVVTPVKAGSTRATVRAFERAGARWRLVLGPFSAVVGRRGFAPPGGKREGDGRTPSGTYALGPAFGYAAAVRTRMPYRQATARDVWVDDPGSPQYNTWVTGVPRARSFERMRRRDAQYSLGIVVQYNTGPVVPGHGSAIFFHVRPGGGRPTAGCIGMRRRDLRRLLAWLDPSSGPVAILGDVP